jgi:hypothetical protein
VKLLLPLFFALWVTSLTWLASVHYLMRLLRERHPEVYHSLGSPQGFDPQTTRAVFTFLFSRRPELLGDVGIRRLANLMRSMFAVFVVGAVVFLFLLQRVAATQPH